MSKRFTITLAVCIIVFFVLNLLRALSGPPARVGVSGWRSIGVPFPVHVENVQYTAAGPVVTTIKNQPWLWVVNVGVWGFLSYRFSRWVDHSGAAWWRGEAQRGQARKMMNRAQWILTISCLAAYAGSILFSIWGMKFSPDGNAITFAPHLNLPWLFSAWAILAIVYLALFKVFGRPALVLRRPAQTRGDS